MFVIAHLWPVYCLFVFVTVRQQIRLEEKIVKEIEQNQLTRYGHVQRMVEGSLPKIALSGCRNKREDEEFRRKTGWKV
jgi:hypothetical protein